MIVIDTVVEIEILTIEAGVAVTALITIEAVVEIDTMMKGDKGAGQLKGFAIAFLFSCFLNSLRHC